MTIYAQHGYGKSDKIDRGLNTGIVDGVVIGPRNEKPDRLVEWAQNLRHNFPDATLILDPQFHLSTITPLKECRLPDYDYYHPDLKGEDFFIPSRIMRYATDVLDFQMKLPVSYLVSPTVLMKSFGESWRRHAAIQIAAASLEYKSDSREELPILLSLVFSETALDDTDNLMRFLNIITKFQPSGFYIVLNREERKYGQEIDSERLKNLLYLVYVLAGAQDQDLNVIVGYTDLLGILLHAVGAKATAFGWLHNLKRFSSKAMRPPPPPLEGKKVGWRQPLPRYLSTPLLNSFSQTEFNAIPREVPRAEVMSQKSIHEEVAMDPRDEMFWRPGNLMLYNWAAMQEIIEDVISGEQNVGNRLARAMGIVANAKRLYSRLQNAGIDLIGSHGPRHLTGWETAITGFAKTAGIEIAS